MYSGATSVAQSDAIDNKVDDGIPVTGRVLATYVNGLAVASAPNAATDSPTTCYNTTSNTYSLSSIANYGTGKNCALSFQFQ